MKKSNKTYFNMQQDKAGSIFRLYLFTFFIVLTGIMICWMITHFGFKDTISGGHRGNGLGLVLIYPLAVFLCIKSLIQTYKNKKYPPLIFDNKFIEIYNNKFHYNDIECYVITKGCVNDFGPFTLNNCLSFHTFKRDYTKSNQILAMKPKKMHKCYTFDLDNTCSQEEAKQIISLLNKHHIKKLTSKKDLQWFTRNFLPKNYEHEHY